MEIILLERVEKLGRIGDTVRVKNGYARNFLLPRGKALRANKANLEWFEKKRDDLEKHSALLRKDAEVQAKTIDNATFTLIRQAGETGQLYGSVSARDIVDLMSEQNCAIKRDQVLLTQTIKMLGIHTARVRLHPEIVATIRLNVARTEEDAAGRLSAEQAAQSIAEKAEDIFEKGAAPDIEQIKQDDDLEISQDNKQENELDAEKKLDEKN